MSPFTRHNNNDGTMSIYRDGKFIAAIDNCTATCDVFYSMETLILELQSKLNKAIKVLEFYANKEDMFDCAYERDGTTIGYIPDIDDFDRENGRDIPHIGKKAREYLTKHKEQQ